LLAAAAFWSALRTDFFCLPGFGWQLPFSPADFPGVGSKPGQQWLAVEGFFFVAAFAAVVMFHFDALFAKPVIQRSIA
jgi:hypothetical protein